MSQQQSSNFVDEVKEKIIQWMKSVPHATRWTAIMMVILNSVRWIMGEERFPLTIRFTTIFPPKMYLWTWLTAGFCESSIVSLLVAVLIMCSAGRFLEQRWGVVEFLRFLIWSNSGTYIVLTTILYLVYLYSHSRYMYIELNLYGITPFFAATSIAYKQLIPENEVIILPGLSFRLKFLPQFTLVFFLIPLFAIGSILPFLTALIAMSLAWVYLRFFQWRELGVRGDHSSAFSFESFFPDLCQ
jgi:membrane associated rhomboid family serine protease